MRRRATFHATIFAAFALLTLALFTNTGRETFAPKVEAGGTTLNQRMNATITSSKIGKRGTAAAVVYELKSGKVVYSHNANKAMTPASNMKVVTTAAAFLELGSDFQLKTQLYRRGTIKDGVLKGDLLIKGYGDPNISGRFNDGDVTEVLRNFALVLRRKGISEVAGKLYFDASYFSGAATHSDWPRNQMNKWYCAEASALSLNDNCITVKIEATTGTRAKLTKIPDTSYVSIEGSIKSKKGRRDPKVAVVRPDIKSNTLKVWGDIYTGKPTYNAECTIHDPAKFFAQTFLEVLYKRGVTVEEGIAAKATTAKDRKAWKLTAEFTSDLPTTIYVCNQRSQNLYAENLFRIVGAEKASDGSLAGGSKAVLAFLKKEGVSTKDLVLADGSGLAKSNKLSVAVLAKLLRKVALKEDGDLFKATLPVAGTSGTLSKRLRGSSTKGRVFAKTGYISGVYSLSGYLDAKNGKKYVFSIILNDAVSRSPVDNFVEALAKG